MYALNEPIIFSFKTSYKLYPQKDSDKQQTTRYFGVGLKPSQFRLKCEQKMESSLWLGHTSVHTCVFLSLHIKNEKKRMN